MARKHNDAPIKLIHILPAQDESPSSEAEESVPTPFRLGIENSETWTWNLLGILKSRFRGPSARSSGTGSSVDKPTNIEDSLIPVRSSFFHTVGSWIERCKTTCRALLAKCRKSDMEQGSHTVPSPSTLLEGETEYAALPSLDPGMTCNDEHSLTEPQDTLSREVRALRDQVRSQHEELARVTAQLTDLKSLVLSQQQVLLHLGKELEDIQLTASAPPPKAPRKSKPRVTKTSKAKASASKKGISPNPPGLEAHP